MNKLMEFYKKECGAYNYVFVNYKWLYRATLSIPLLTIFISTICVIMIRNETRVAIFWLFWGLTIIAGVVFFLILNSKYKRYMCDTYDASRKTFVWRNTEVNEIIFDEDVKKTSGFLLEHNKFTKGAMENLLNKVSAEAEAKKPRFPVVPAIIGAMVVSLFNNFINWMIKNVTTMDEAIYVIASGVSMILVIAMFMSIFRQLYHLFSVFVFAREYNYLLKCEEVLEYLIEAITE